MKVFISWSGDRSRRVAELLQEWVQCVIQAVEPWVSSSDIDRGSLWFSEIINELSSTTHGIICITNENKVRSWILFEAGALAKGLASSRVYTFLVDLQPEDIKDPLAQFNATKATKEDMRKLIYSINRGLEAQRLDEAILRKSFETFWPHFEEEFKKILEDTAADVPAKEPRDQQDILSEILNSVRGIDRRVRSLETNNTHSEESITGSLPRRLMGWPRTPPREYIDEENSVKKLLNLGWTDNECSTPQSLDSLWWLS